MSDMRCAMTGVPIEPGDGIWDDGEWLSWEWINSQLDDEEEPEDSFEEDNEAEPTSQPSPLELTPVFYALVDASEKYKELTGRHLEIWGELGELYAEICYGLIKHPRNFPGSDGTILEKLVEVKTISPYKRSDKVRVKRGGNFEQLLIVIFSEEFRVSSKLFNRADLKEGLGSHISARFSSDAAP